MQVGVRRAIWTCVVVGWVAGVGTGLNRLWSYQSTPGPLAHAPAEWPARTWIDRRPGVPTLILALHPHCPCSQATVAELSRLVARAARTVSIHVLFVAAPDADSAWVHSPLWHAAAAIPGVQVARDDGSEARRFGARVSGQLLAYDADGRLAFNGGITAARGHQGDNRGRSAVEAMLAGRPHDSTSLVFGCFL